MRHEKKIDYLIIWKKLHGIQQPQEQVEFDEWVRRCEKNPAFFNRLKKYYHQESLDIKDEEIKAAWERLESNLKQPSKLNLTKWFKVAAAILLPVAISITLFFLINRIVQTPQTVTQSINPGQAKATLELEDGQTIVLESANRTIIQDDKGVVIGTDSLHVLKYPKQSEGEKLQYNTIKVPRGGEYKLELSDGTRVWLNSETTLKYPVSFIDSVRKVQLKGEALFEVAKNVEKPFLVQTDISTIRVLGTTFNVMSYVDDDLEETTLVEGSVLICYGQQEVVMAPGQQSQIIKADHLLNIRDVNTSVYTAWRDGFFVFDDQNLETILRKVARWYDIKVIFKNEEDRKIVFKGNLPRYGEWSELLKVIESGSDVHFTLDGRNLIVN